MHPGSLLAVLVFGITLTLALTVNDSVNLPLELQPLQTHQGEFYMCVLRLNVGTPPQQLRVAVDAGLDWLQVNDVACSQSVCRQAPRYNPSLSSSARAQRTFSGSYGFGLFHVTGELYADVLSYGLSSLTVNAQPVVAVRRYRLLAFGDAPISGISGSLGVGRPTGNNLSFVDGFAPLLAQRHTFAILLPSASPVTPTLPTAPTPPSAVPAICGSLQLGAISSLSYTGALHWWPVTAASVQANSTLWSGAFDFVRVGAQTVISCESSSPVSASVTSVHHSSSVASVSTRSLSPSSLVGGCGGFFVDPAGGNLVLAGFPSLQVAADCSNLAQLPSVVFGIAGQTYSLEPHEYVMLVNHTCVSSVTAAPSGSLSVLGTTWLRKYLTAFDARLNRVGFALGQQSFLG
jgi:saccharopepsin